MQLLESRSGSRRRRWVKPAIFIGIPVLALAGWQGWQKARPHYLRWKQQRALTQAREFIEKHDAPNAQMALEVALRTVPGNPETLRVAADLLEQVGSPQAMRLRRNVVAASPDSAEDAARLVLCCLRFRDFNAAKDAISRMPKSMADQPVALRAALAYAIATNDSPVADYIFEKLRALAPDDKNLRHAHALLLLKHPKDEIREKAEAELLAIAKAEPDSALQINRELAGAALLRRDYATAKLRMKEVLADPQASLGDRLRKANVDLVVDRQPFEPIYAELAPLASATPAEAVEFTQWLIVQNRAAEADKWLAALPDSIRSDPSVKSAQADVIAQLKDWDRLDAALAAGAWGPIPKDVLRLAMAARTVDSPARPSLRRETWEMTISAAGTNLPALRVLQRLAATWQWTDESEFTLWTIARTFPEQTWAHQSLFNLYRQKKNTGSMRDVMAALRRADGTVPRYQHDWALLTMLTESTSSWNPPKDTMRRLYETEPANSTYATGYAFALALAGKSAEALAIVEKLSPSDRDFPPRQPYLAFVYGLAKKQAEFERAQKLGEGTSFLPEESYLFVRGKEELNRKPPAKPKAPQPSAESARAKSAS